MSAPVIPSHALHARLEAGLAALQCKLDGDARQSLVEYIELLAHWNRAYNLTAVRDPLQMVDRHLLDALSLLPHLRGSDLADVGSGAGIPGLVLALVHPLQRVWLIDSNGKKARFLRECVRRFELDQVSVREARVERLRAEAGFGQIVSRAFAELGDFLRLTRHLLAPGGEWLAMKGRFPEAEIARLPKDIELRASHRLQVPGDSAERHLLVLGVRG